MLSLSPDGAAPVDKLALPWAEEPLALWEEVSVGRGATYVDCLARNSRTDGQTQSWPLLGDTGDRGAAAAVDSSNDRRMVPLSLSGLGDGDC